MGSYISGSTISDTNLRRINRSFTRAWDNSERLRQELIEELYLYEKSIGRKPSGLNRWYFVVHSLKTKLRAPARDRKSAQDAIFFRLRSIIDRITAYRQQIRETLTPYPYNTNPSHISGREVSDSILQFIDKFEGNSDLIERTESWPEEQREFFRQVKTWDDEKSFIIAMRCSREWIEEHDNFVHRFDRTRRETRRW